MTDLIWNHRLDLSDRVIAITIAISATTAIVGDRDLLGSQISEIWY